MTILQNLLDPEKLEALIAEGYISRKIHNKYPLAILNYSPQAQYDINLEWGVEMRASRGLIYNIDNQEIVARPFPKFFNINDDRHPETLEVNLPLEVPLITDKLDGSLGVLFKWDGLNQVATRGSFASDQAKWATEWLQRRYPRLELPKEYTILTEVIFKENRIVLDYDFEGLVVLGAVNIATGAELSRSQLKEYCRAMGLDIVPEFNKTLAQCVAEDIAGREGYVLTFPSTGLKVKAKFETYCRLHKVVTGLNPKTIWELFRDGNTAQIEVWLADEKMPPNFIVWLKSWTAQLRNDYQTILDKAQAIFASCPKFETRKDFALYFLQPENKAYAAILFELLDGKEPQSTIWKMIQPKFSDTFRVDGE